MVIGSWQIYFWAQLPVESNTAFVCPSCCLGRSERRQSFLSKAFKRIQLTGVRSPKTYQLRKDSQRFGPQMMLDSLDFPAYRIGIQTDQLQELGKGFVPGLDILRYLMPRRGERKSAVSFIIDKATPRQPAHHVRHR